MVPDQIKRDAQWVLDAPSMMCIPVAQDATRWLRALNCQVMRLKCPAETPGRLGLYYESLVTSVINTSPYISDIKRNIQVRENLKTLGEFDLIGRHMDGYDFHLECAIKFYLCAGSSATLADFEGPNRRDRLDLKWHKMNAQQIRLSDQPAARELLREIGYEITRHFLLIQGYLFYPFENQTTTKPDAALHMSHLRGWWLRAHALNRLPDGFAYKVLRKPHWLALGGDEPCEVIHGRDPLQTYIDSCDQPVLLARIRRCGATWMEVDRGFIVPDNW